MSITFSLMSTSGPAHSRPAPITPRQLAAFRAFARENRILTDDFDDEPEHLSYSFEASTCRFAWPVIAGVLGSSEAVVAVVEEAHFLGRKLLFYRDRETHTITVRASEGIDGFEEINLHDPNAYAVLESLGLPADNCGEIDLEELRQRLADPQTRRRFINAGIGRRLCFFEAAAGLDEGLNSPCLVWS